MTISRNDTSSIRSVATVIALSALSVTTTFNTSGMIYIDSPPAIMENSLKNDINDMGTTTPSPKMSKTELKSSYDLAKELFENDMRDFTKEEAEIYKESLKKIYKPTGVNIFDIC